MSSIIFLAIAFFSLIALMIIHEFGHFIIAKKFGVRVDEFGIGYPPKIYGKKFGETIYSINWIPLGAFVRIHGEEGGIDDYRSFTNLKIWQRTLIIIGGVVAHWLTAIVIFSIVFFIGAELPISDTQDLKSAQIKVVGVANDSPASGAGLKIGDTMLQVESLRYEGTQVSPEMVTLNKTSDFSNFAKAHAGEQIKIKIRRGNEILDVRLTPRANPPVGQGSIGIGIERMTSIVEKTNWYFAPIRGITYTWDVTVGAIRGLYITLSDLIMGKGTPEGAEFAGPLGITVYMANAASYGVGFFLYFIGMICTFIAIFNLFPIPALDGGKLLFLLIEKIKGKPVSVKIEQGITITCFAILIALSLFITIKFDIPRFNDFIKSAF